MADVRTKPEKWNSYSKALPSNIIEKILKYRRWQDQQKCLTARLLLKEGVSQITGWDNCLHYIQIDNSGKPYIPDSSLDFNITHSDLYCACAISSSKIGIDIEKIRSLNINDFNSILTDKEQRFINSSIDKKKAFFIIWTRKESLLKACGTGLLTTADLSSICVYKNPVYFKNGVWNLFPADIAEGYVSHIASSKKNPAVEIHELSF